MLSHNAEDSARLVYRRAAWDRLWRTLLAPLTPEEIAAAADAAPRRGGNTADAGEAQR